MSTGVWLMATTSKSWMGPEAPWMGKELGEHGHTARRASQTAKGHRIVKHQSFLSCRLPTPSTSTCSIPGE